MSIHDTGFDFPDVDPGCCYGSAAKGPEACTCWEPQYDKPQQDIVKGLEPVERQDMCHDCAYKFGSPERVEGFDEDWLLSLPISGERFFCHQGMRRILRCRHPSGAVLEAPPGAYDPPRSGSIAYRADGTPEQLCGGWAARKAYFDRERAVEDAAS